MLHFRNYIGRMLAGWVMSLMMALVGALLRRALSNAGKKHVRRPQPSSPQPDPFVKPQMRNPEAGSQPFRPQPFRQWAVQDTIFQGMDKTELISAYGEPVNRKNHSSDREIWMYNTPAMTVTLDKGVVTDWSES
jgi:hypothetical protein